MAVFSTSPARARRWRLFLPILLLLLASIPFPTQANAATCQFVLGFRTLHELIPSIVGDCVTNEMFDPATGNSVQTSTHGLLVWRKADNHTAFTDGFRTWVNGPFGLQVRLNTARFPWETDAAPSNVDARLSVAYQLALASQFSGLISNLAAKNIPVGVASLGPNVFGQTSVDQTTGKITVNIDPSVIDGDPHDAAAVLIHEATHAYNFSHGVNITTGQQCLNEEFTATQNDLSFWQSSFGSAGKPNPTNLFEQSENSEVRLAESSLRALLVATFETYRGECGL